MSEEKFIFTAGAKKKLIIMLVVGVVLTVLGIVMANSGGHGHEEVAAAAGHGADATHGGGHGGGAGWLKRLYTSLWINNVYFVGLALVGVLFVALQYVTQAGWSAPIKRVPEAFGYWLPIGGVLMIVTFLVANHDLFHWTHEYLYDKASPEYDSILDNKKAYLNFGFFLGRTVVYFVVWTLLFFLIRKYSLLEDKVGGTEPWYKIRKYSVIFVVFFGVTSSTSAWDWVMSVDPHWFSTLFGWYVFSSYFVAGLAGITFLVLKLKDYGYLKVVKADHIHDMGKFVFGFSVFWTYLWFSQFLLYYYSNIPEETIYYVDRLVNDHYSPYFLSLVFINFVIPFFVLMTRDSKRQGAILKIACIVILIGHWLDFFMMITPGIMKNEGSIGFMEVGVTLVYLSAFLFVALTQLSKAGLVAHKHPMMKEAMHHHI
ncbi:hypothetical protein FUAX_28910 [Fulvitalea axinellae]|uniref:Quinol:cytochrome C oxidoreductase n=1 Tax=Fulvitalea axinellae TaxID=1182444 RepID=A0AAU9D7F0_9BACT|nr:hypothetical protein FUAX_28910 [Fulvitalea axinellae]